MAVKKIIVVALGLLALVASHVDPQTVTRPLPTWPPRQPASTLTRNPF